MKGAQTGKRGESGQRNVFSVMGPDVLANQADAIWLLPFPRAIGAGRDKPPEELGDSGNEFGFLLEKRKLSLEFGKEPEQGPVGRSVAVDKQRKARFCGAGTKDLGTDRSECMRADPDHFVFRADGIGGMHF